jgi:hypothetical protein
MQIRNAGDLLSVFRVLAAGQPNHQETAAYDCQIGVVDVIRFARAQNDPHGRERLLTQAGLDVVRSKHAENSLHYHSQKANLQPPIASTQSGASTAIRTITALM